ATAAASRASASDWRSPASSRRRSAATFACARAPAAAPRRSCAFRLDDRIETSCAHFASREFNRTMSTLKMWPDPGYEKILERIDADPAAQKKLARLTWVATEKIHGAHFALVSDGAALRCAKRKGYLLPGESFFAHEGVVERLRPAIAALHK